jgi:hypothetical protein
MKEIKRIFPASRKKQFLSTLTANLPIHNIKKFSLLDCIFKNMDIAKNQTI